MTLYICMYIHTWNLLLGGGGGGGGIVGRHILNI